ncbi:MAG TPA: hypothetical protein DIT66_04660 [Rhodobiaceae bacterium]|nr:hypothetical protein [Rhodobiaceae bacterium]
MKEPGGYLLVGLGAPVGAVRAEILRRRDQDASLTVLIEPAQTGEVADADDAWVFTRLGPVGFVALIRRISWRRFDRVYQFRDCGFSWLKYCVWPRPPWFYISEIGAEHDL